MATWYAQLSTDSFFSVSGGTTSDMWNSAANGSGSWLDTSSDYSADTFNSNGKTDIALDANVTAAELTSAGGAGTWLINTSDVTITANLVAGTTQAFRMNSGTPTNVNIVGNLSAGSSSSDSCVEVSVAGELDIQGNVTGGSGAGAHGLSVTAAATVTIAGTVTGGGGVAAYGVGGSHPTGTFTITITGSVVADASAGAGLVGAGGTALTIQDGNIVDTATVNAILLRGGTMLFDPGPTNYYRIRTAGATTIDLSAGSSGGGPLVGSSALISA